jgi:hypothetical protein
VLSIDLKGKRVALSMKALEAAPATPKRKNFQQPKPEAQKPSLTDQLSALQNKFKVKA